jgi:putative SOS response-associated peptidase YedK
MCGRFTLRTSPSDLQAELGFVLEQRLAPRFNIAPTQRVAVVTNAGQNRVELFRWGLIPSWAKDASIGSKMINARAETAAEKPSFRVALRKRRCVILADGFYEWRVDGKRKVPMYIRMESRRPFALAGLWETWRDPSGEVVPTCTILTTSPNPFMAAYHDRMPVILPRDRLAQWLSPEPKEASDLAPLLCAWTGEDLEAHPVSTLVNSPANDRPECVEPA